MRQNGFSMIEVLVALVIIATALLGMAGLQVYAMRMTKGGEFRTQAVFLAADIGERMEANKLGAVAGYYAVSASSAPHAASSDCGAGACSPSALADWDVAQWESAIASSGMPQANWLIQQTGAGNPAIYRITINWTDRGGTASARSEAFSYVSTRVIGLPGS